MLTGTNLKYANSYNLRIVLEMIRLYGPLSRIDISRKTQLMAQTVTNITKKLLRADLIYESDRHQEGRGAPSIMLKINPTAAYSIGLDFDKDHLTCVLVDLNGRIRQRLNMELDCPAPDETMDLMSDKVNELIRMANLERDKIWGIGVGFPGPMALLDGSVRANAVNPQFLPGWDHVPVVRILEERLQIPVCLENNASAAALGERWYGAGKDVETFFYIFLGAGLGGGLVINRQLFPGHTGNAGELGYCPIAKTPDLQAENAFGVPHLGMYFNLLVLYKELARNGFHVNSPEELDELFQQKNELVMNWLKAGTEQLVNPVLSIEYLIDPEIIFFGGRLPVSMLEEVIHMLEKILPTYRIPNLKKTPDLSIAAAGQDAAALGLATLPIYTSFAPIPSLLMKQAESGMNTFNLI